MKKSISFNSAFLVLFGIGLTGMVSVSLAQDTVWTTKTDMPTARSSLSASVVDGKIYAIGGGDVYDKPSLSTVEEYNPLTDSWTQKENMPTGRFLLSTSVVNGIIYAIGGSPYNIAYTTEAVSTVEAYDPATNSWTIKTNMPTKRWSLSTSVVGGKIYAIGGGKVDPWTAFSVVEEYDPVKDSWTTKASMPTPRWGLTTSVVNGKIYAIGGHNESQKFSIVEEYDPATDTWTKKSDMSGKRTLLSSSVVNGIIYVIGGMAGSSTILSRVEMYNPDNDTWTMMTAMPTPRWGLAASTVNNRIYAIGGESVEGILSKVEEYDPLSDHPTSVENHYPSQAMYFSLNQNYPNPFNTSTMIRYALNVSCFVTLTVFDLPGREMVTLVNETKAPGEYSIELNGQGLPGGIYYYQLKAGDFTETRKLVLQK